MHRASKEIHTEQTGPTKQRRSLRIASKQGGTSTTPLMLSSHQTIRSTGQKQRSLKASRSSRTSGTVLPKSEESIGLLINDPIVIRSELLEESLYKDKRIVRRISSRGLDASDKTIKGRRHLRKR